jgi:hypothetical protein
MYQYVFMYVLTTATDTEELELFFGLFLMVIFFLSHIILCIFVASFSGNTPYATHLHIYIYIYKYIIVGHINIKSVYIYIYILFIYLDDLTNK